MTRTNTIITTEGLQLNLNPSGLVHTEGLSHWDDDNKTLAVDLEETNVELQVGQEQHIRCTNQTGSIIYDGQAVYINGAQGQRPTIALAKADGDITGQVIGLATHNISNNNTGYVTIQGKVNDVDTSSFVNGSALYLSDVSGGYLTMTPPNAPNCTSRVGYCLYSHATEGKILVSPNIFPHLMELCDVNGTVPSNNGILVYNAGSQYWDATDSIGSYAKLNGTNQPFTGSVIVQFSSTAPNQVKLKLTETNVDSTSRLQIDTGSWYNWELASAGGDNEAGITAGHFYIRNVTSGINAVNFSTDGNMNILGSLTSARNFQVTGSIAGPIGSFTNLLAGTGSMTGDLRFFKGTPTITLSESESGKEGFIRKIDPNNEFQISNQVNNANAVFLSHQNGVSGLTILGNSGGDINLITNTLINGSVICSGLIVNTQTLVVSGTNVGIGISGPAIKLDVYENAAGTYVADFDQDSSTGYGIRVSTDSNVAGDPVLQLNSAIGTIARFDANGRVGIGTNDPTSTLYVSGNTTIIGSLLVSGVHLIDNNKITFGTANDSSIYYDGTNMHISPDDVGLGYISMDGTISPSYKDAYFRFKSGTSSASYDLGIWSNTNNHFIFGAWDTGYGLQLDTENGRLGIGNLVDPDCTLHVGGNGLVTGSLTAGSVITGVGSFAGNIYFKQPYASLTTNSTLTVPTGSTLRALPMYFDTIEDAIDITVSGGSIINFTRGGDYMVNLSIMCQSAAANSHVEVWPCINGSNVPRSNTRYEFKSVNSEAVLAVPFILDMEPGDTLCVSYASDNTGVQLTYTGSTSYSPATPSCIACINKISESQ